MSLNTICSDVYNEVTGAIAVAVVDLSNGLLLAVHHEIPYFDQSYVDLVSAAAVNMFRGHTVNVVEEALTAQRGRSAMNSINEIQMTTDGTFHFMAIIPGKPQFVAILITTKRASLGLGWASLRRALPSIEKECP